MTDSKQRTRRARRGALWCGATLAALAISCSMPSHGDRHGDAPWVGLGDDDGGSAQVTAAAADVTCPTYDPSRIADGPPDEPAVDAVGGMPGSFRVDDDGAAAYTVPLRVIPAPLQPELALTYNSNGGNGLVGVGFSLDGLSSITRCPRNEFDDGESSGILLNRYGPFCLDGLRLVAVSGDYGANGTEYRTLPDTFVRVVSYGGSNGSETEPYTGPQWFRVWRKDGRILDYGTDEIMEGGINNARFMVGQVARKWSLSAVRDRPGNTMRYDYLAVTQDGNTVEQLPLRIAYGGHVNGRSHDRFVEFSNMTRPDVWSGYSLGVKVQRQKRLSFIWVRREGAYQGYARWYELEYGNGGSSGRSKLERITEHAPGGGNGPSRRPTTFSWQLGEEGFESPQPQAGVFHIQTPSPTEYGARVKPVVLDANGDGRDDLAFADSTRWYLAYSQGGFSPFTQATPTAASTDGWCSVIFPPSGEEISCDATAFGWPLDYDQDGRTDLLPMTRGDRWQVHLARPGQGLLTVNTNFQRSVGPFGKYYPPLVHSLATGKYFVDLNGDGIRDLLEMSEGLDGEGPKKWRYRRHRGHAFRNIDLPPYEDDLGFMPAVDVHPLDGVWPNDVLIVDMDGDGKEEILFSHDGGDYLGLRWEREREDVPGDVVPEFSFFSTGLDGDTRTHHRAFADVNGDGLRDLVTAPFDPSDIVNDRRPEPWYLWINTGQRFLPGLPAVLPDTVASPPFLGPPAALGAATAVDYDGDGREDLLVPWVAGASFPSDPFEQHTLTRYILLKAERGGEAFRVIDPSIAFNAVEPEHHQVGAIYTAVRSYNASVLDADGDGQQDLLTTDFVPETRISFHRHRGGGTRPDVVVAIREGQNEPDGSPGADAVPPTVKIQYSPLVDALEGQSLKTYQGGSCYGEPGYKCYRGPRFVVQSHAIDTGRPADEAMVSFHEYKSARVLRTGRAWLGFAEHKVRTFFGGYGPITTRVFYDNKTYDKGMRGPHVTEVWTYGALNKPGFSGPGLWLSRRANGRLPTTEVPAEAGWVTKLHPTGATGFAYVETSFAGEYEAELPPETLDDYERSDVDQGVIRPYAASSRRVTQIDEYGNVLEAETSFEGDGAGSTAVSAEYANDGAQWFVGRPSAVTTTDVTPNGSQTRSVVLEYVEGEAANLVHSVTTSSPNAPGHFARTAFDYDESGNVRRTTLADGAGNQRASCVTYEPDGTFPHALVNAAGHTTYVKMHPLLGTPWARVDANGLRTAWTYDQLGRPLSVERPGGSTTRLQYFKEHVGPEWLVGTASVEASGERTEEVRDRLGRVVLERFVGLDGQKRVRARSFFSQGMPDEITLWAREGATPAGSFSFGYDGRFRQRFMTRPDGAQVETRYDELTTTVVDTRGHASSTTRDARGQIARAVDAKGTARSYTYGPFGALLRTRAELPSGALTESEFDVDAFGRITRTYDAERGAKSFAYDDFGQLISATDALGRQFFYDYDALGRRTRTRQLHQGQSTIEAETSYVYDIGEGKAVGRPTRVNHVDNANQQWHQLTYRYDGLGRLAKLDNVLPTDSGAGSERLRVQFAYDAFDRLHSLTYPALPGQVSPAVVGYDYGAHGHLDALRFGTGLQAPALWEASETDEADRVTLERFGNAAETRRAYHPFKGTLESISTRTTAPDVEPGRQLQSLAYVFDGEGNLEQRVDLLQGHTEHFVYDELDRLESLTLDNEPSPRVTYGYDLLGNVTHKSDVGAYAYDPLRPHLVTSVNGEAYGHDAVGNQIARPGNEAVTYNGFDLPARVTRNGAPIARFAYSGGGARVRKVSSEGTTTYAAGLYERHRKPNGAVEHRLLAPAPGRGPVAVLRYVEQGGQSLWQPPLFVHDDHLGSTDLVTSDTSDWLAPEPAPPHATIAERRSYDPFGRPRHPDWAQNGPVSTPSALNQGFTGHTDDPELGLVNMRGRVYDPKLGRFLTPDPFVQAPTYSQSWNRYAYAFNNPLRFVDPSGFTVADPARGCHLCPHYLLLRRRLRRGASAALRAKWGQTP